MAVAVTGMGIVCAIGNDGASVLDALRKGHTGIGKMEHLPSSHKELPVGEVKMTNGELKAALGVAEDAVVSRTTLMGAYAIKQALADAGLEAEGLKGRRVALVSGTTVGGMDVTERLFSKLEADDTLLRHVCQHDCGSGTRDMATLCGLECEVCTISTACSSALNAIMVGCDMLAGGEADVVLAGGAEALSLFHLNGFNTLMILDHGQCRPFDKCRAGLNLGEGAAFVVLERGDGDGRAKAYVCGGGNRCDAFHQTASSDNGEGAYLAMTDALREAGMKAEEVRYVNAHGTGTPNNDPSESAALRRVFGNGMPAVSSTKGFTGHTTSASGAIETVISILAMRHGIVPRNLGWQEADEACITPSPGEEGVTLNNVLCNAFGFGGNDSSIVLCREPRQAATPTQGGYEAEVAADIVIDNAEQLKDSREYMTPMEARRMGRLMKAATMTSLMALRESGVETPDAIVTATAYGMLETSEKFLKDICDNGEELLKPTLFMQSTHNTIGSAIAIRTRCHGYNITYSQGADSLAWALRDARRLIATGKARTVLVGCHDEATPLFQDICRRMNMEPPRELYSRSMVLRRRGS